MLSQPVFQNWVIGHDYAIPAQCFRLRIKIPIPLMGKSNACSDCSEIPLIIFVVLNHMSDGV